MTRFVIRRSVVYAVSALILLITLFFGLKPKGFRFYNQVEWLRDRNGISFFNTGMAYSEKRLCEIGISDSMTIAVVIRPYQMRRHISEIISIIDEGGNELLEVEQWKGSLMSTLWDSAGHRIGRLSIGNALSVDSTRFAAIVISRSEMKFSIPGSSPSIERRMIQLPQNFFAGGRMLLGLGANGRNPWRGELSGLAIFTSELTSHEIATLANCWKATGNFRPILKEKPAALFLFDAHRGTSIADRSGNGWDLHIPPYPRFFKYEVLTFLPNLSKIDRGYIEDMIINFLGFMPLGGCLYAAFLYSFASDRKSTLFAVCSALFISLCIELAQVFIPTRTSQLTDVILNGAGAWAGAVLARIGLGLIGNRDTGVGKKA